MPLPSAQNHILIPSVASFLMDFMKLDGFSIMLELLDQSFRKVDCTSHVLKLLSTISKDVLQWPKDVFNSSYYPEVRINVTTFQELLDADDTEQVLSVLLILRHVIECHSGGESLLKVVESNELLRRTLHLTQWTAVSEE